MPGERQADAEVRIRAVIQQLLAGDIPEGLKCDVKSLCTLSGVPRATLYRGQEAMTSSPLQAKLRTVYARGRSHRESRPSWTWRGTEAAARS
jgi:hypothetical protein